MVNATLIVSTSLLLVGAVVALIFFLRENSDDATYLGSTKWSITTADSTTSTWYVSGDASSIKIVTAPAADEGTLTIEEFIGDKKYTYWSPDPDKLTVDTATYASAATGYSGDINTFAAELASDVESMKADWVDNKANCIIEDAQVPIVTSTAKVPKDGVVDFGGFNVKFEGSTPTQIIDPDDDTVIATINSVESWSGDAPTGCAPSDDASGDASRRLDFYDTIAESRKRRTLGDVDEETAKARASLDAIYLDMAKVDGHEEEARRHLGAWTDFQAWASNTVWCGAGTDLTSTCPGDAGGDTEANYACHRHDHGKKSNGIIGGYAVRLGCDIDRGLADRTSNWAAQAFSAPGASRKLGAATITAPTAAGTGRASGGAATGGTVATAAASTPTTAPGVTARTPTVTDGSQAPTAALAL
eukprot:CAMPEP_0182459366 /NCGR_PEP_ID=MMETSP1319-20130603/4517_1 /TAXON_ID=172717 /ORGANISM="Bolidomonas pacifica, Strain RCC208" /LENGTH=416 /DNA_ID=CAMNT_0024658275 /DNA_START=47 /DNA_END=1298 /DNA_ORIENTATION=-